jgi:large subunit ribosomal protein L21
MFAVIHIGGKQYKVQEMEELSVEKVDLEVGKHLKVKEVLMISDDEGKEMKLGMPYVKGAHVECAVVEHGRGEKIKVFKMKPKKRYSKTQGHRQSYTLLKVLKISSVAKKVAKPAKEEKAEKEVEV